MPQFAAHGELLDFERVAVLHEMAGDFNALELDAIVAQRGSREGQIGHQRFALHAGLAAVGQRPPSTGQAGRKPAAELGALDVSTHERLGQLQRNRRRIAVDFSAGQGVLAVGRTLGAQLESKLAGLAPLGQRTAGPQHDRLFGVGDRAIDAELLDAERAARRHVVDQQRAVDDFHMRRDFRIALGAKNLGEETFQVRVLVAADRVNREPVHLDASHVAKVEQQPDERLFGAHLADFDDDVAGGVAELDIVGHDARKPTQRGRADGDRAIELERRLRQAVAQRRVRDDGRREIDRDAQYQQQKNQSVAERVRFLLAGPCGTT